MKHVYAYSTATGVEKRPVIGATLDSVTIASGLSGHVVRRSALDTPDGWYFTTARKAIEAFVAKAHAALADASREQHHAGWRKMLSAARKQLEALS